MKFSCRCVEHKQLLSFSNQIVSFLFSFTSKNNIITTQRTIQEQGFENERDAETWRDIGKGKENGSWETVRS